MHVQAGYVGEDVESMLYKLLMVIFDLLLEINMHQDFQGSFICYFVFSKLFLLKSGKERYDMIKT